MFGRYGAAATEKNTLKPWLKEQWCIPEVSGTFVAAMEDVLALYAEPYEAKRPKVNFDETSRQLIADRHSPLPGKAGRPQREDHEYERKGTRNLFIFCEPQAGWRHVTVTERRTKHDFAQQMQWLVDERYPHAEVIRVILDNLNTHGPGSLYEVFEPAEARRLVEKLEFHYTPKHGSWLNMAEIELSILQRQCLNRRIATEELLQREVAAWAQQRNTAQETIDWRFSITDAREKLKRLYPTNSLR